MSTQMKVVLAVVAAGGIVLIYSLIQSQMRFEAQFSPHQSLEQMKASGNLEVRSREDWLKEQGAPPAAPATAPAP
jgi:hypothetical protein